MTSKTTNKFSLRSVPARCGWCSIMNASIRRGGRRLSRWRQDRLLGADSERVDQTSSTIDSGKRAGVPTAMAGNLKALERENRELRQANEILRKASAYFAQAELDRGVKP